jgi:hypothetical protein
MTTVVVDETPSIHDNNKDQTEQRQAPPIQPAQTTNSARPLFTVEPVENQKQT